jgi:hypothetical protein
MRITRDRQRRLLWILNRFSIKLVALPASANPEVELRLYQVAIGSIMYVMLVSRPDLAYPIGKLSQFSSKPSKTHWTSVKRIFRYLKATRLAKLQFGSTKQFGSTNNSELYIVGYTDADWAANLDNR